MSFIDPLARQLERFIYERVSALSELAPHDGGSLGPRDALASPVDGAVRHTTNNRR